MARGAIVFAAWWVALTALWLLAVGTMSRTELVSGLLAAFLGAASALVARDVLSFRPGIRARALVDARAVPWHVVRDSAVVLGALVRGTRSSWGERPVRARSAGLRAFAAWAGSIAPNTIVADIDRERGSALVHDLDPKRARDSVP